MKIPYANVLGSKLAMVAKLRWSGSEVDALNVVWNIDEQNVLLVDDITVTGKTLVERSKLLEKKWSKILKSRITLFIDRRGVQFDRK